MYAAQATQTNIATLRQRGFTILEPEEGRMAEPMEGKGRLPEPATIEGHIRMLLGQQNGILRGRRVVVTAGPTREALDPLRFLSNRSSGRMGYALAEAARDAGATVTLISGPAQFDVPVGVELVPVESALQMRDAVQHACTGADVLIMNAAVADFRPDEVAEHKIKKQGKSAGLTLHLVPNPDIVGELSERHDLFRVGFAAETQDIAANASSKMQRKGLNMIIANEAVASMDRLDIQVSLMDAHGGTTVLPRQSKAETAAAIVHIIGQHLT
jgi:phosphopantothenoylcysteine decarboxylase/phosphopantothenate--cysteine ligase